MIVEDEALLAFSLSEDLQQSGFRTVGPFYNLASALTAANEENCDAAVLDVNLGGERVFPAAEALHARNIPFVFVTGYGAESLPPEFREFPRLAKPYDLPAVVNVLNTLLQK